eukprot:2357934-Amphidinium_carterae.1
MLSNQSPAIGNWRPSISKHFCPCILRYVIRELALLNQRSSVLCPIHYWLLSVPLEETDEDQAIDPSGGQQDTPPSNDKNNCWASASNSSSSDLPSMMFGGNRY